MDLRKRRSQEKLQSALIKHLQIQNFSDISIEQLTKTAGISRQTFYSHYDNKHSILAHRLDEIFEITKADKLCEHAQLSLHDDLVFYLQTVFTQCTREPALTRAAFIYLDNKQILDKATLFMHTVFNALFKQNNGLNTNSIVVAIDFYAGAFVSCVLAWLLDDQDERNSTAPVDDIANLILQGLSHSLELP